MTITVVPALLSNADNFEKIRDQVGLILATNIAHQKFLHEQNGGDAKEWDIRVYLERMNPWQSFLDNTEERPHGIINVWYESSNYDMQSSHKHGQQASGVTLNIDCVGYGVAGDNGAGQIAGDEAAARATQKILRFVRNILDSEVNFLLQLPQGAVLRTWVASQIMVEPPQGVDSGVQSLAARVRFDVSTKEYSPESEKNPLCDLSIDIVRAGDGSILVEADFSYG